MKPFAPLCFATPFGTASPSSKARTGWTTCWRRASRLRITRKTGGRQIVPNEIEAAESDGLRVLVTGATGHLGAALTQLLVRRGACVAILARPNCDMWRLRGVEDRITVLRGTMEDMDAVRDELVEWGPEVAIHLAWHGVQAAQCNDPAQILTNVPGSLKLWQHVVAAGCRTWIGVGSQAEYGPKSEALTEYLSTNPLTLYGAAKLSVGQLTERLCEDAGIRYVWLRLVATYGPRDDPSHIIPAVTRKLLAGERPSLTPGGQTVDYLYVDDAAEALHRAATTSSVAPCTA